MGRPQPPPELTLKTRACRVLFEAWLGWRDGRLLPDHRNVDPAVLKGILPYVVILEVRAEDQVIIRLAGSAYREMFGRELTGLNLVDLSRGNDRRQGAYRNHAAATWPCGRHAETSFMYSKGIPDTFEFLSLPLAPNAPGEPPKLINAMESVLGRRWQNESVAFISARPGDFSRFVDIGAGIPPSLEAPADFLPY